MTLFESNTFAIWLRRPDNFCQHQFLAGAGRCFYWTGADWFVLDSVKGPSLSGRDLIWHAGGTGLGDSYYINFPSCLWGACTKRMLHFHVFPNFTSSHLLVLSAPEPVTRPCPHSRKWPKHPLPDGRSATTCSESGFCLFFNYNSLNHSTFIFFHWNSWMQ